MIKKVLFIVNPTSGNGRKRITGGLISEYLDEYKFRTEIVETTKAKHACELTRLVKNEFDVFVAVGGDGTINEVACELIGTNKVVGIIPAGSGNGLARSLKIPMNTAGALKTINDFHTTLIDAVEINGKNFFNVAGVGFDAYVAKLFTGKVKRGLQGYVKIVAKKFMTYKGKKFDFSINGQNFSERAFLLSFANTTQFGNNAHIAPYAKYDDGKFELCVIKDFPRWKTPELAMRLFNKTLPASPFYHSYSLEELNLNADGEIWAHLDGEVQVFHDQLKLHVKSNALNVIRRVDS